MNNLQEDRNRQEDSQEEGPLVDHHVSLTGYPTIGGRVRGGGAKPNGWKGGGS